MINFKNKEYYEHPFYCENGCFTLYTSFSDAIKDFPNADFNSNKLEENVFWCENVDDFLKSFFFLNTPEFIPTLNKVGKMIEVKDKLFYKSFDKFYIYDKKISNYFEEFESEVEILDIELEFKKRGFFNYNSFLFQERCKSYYGYNFDFLAAYLILDFLDKPVIFDESLFEHIFYCKNELEKVRYEDLDANTFQVKREGKKEFFSFKYNIANTGRIFPAEKGLQNISKSEKGMIKARKGFTLFEFDFKSFEYNLLLDALQVPKINEDRHLKILEFLEIRNANREFGKKLNYAILYGMNVDKVLEVIKEETGFELEKEKVLEYELFKYNLSVKKENGLIYTYFNRPIVLEKEWAVRNYYCQGTAADIFFKKLKSIFKVLKGKQSRVLLQNHDSILLEIENKSKNLPEEIYNILKAPIEIFTFEIDAKYGLSWDKMKY